MSAKKMAPIFPGGLDSGLKKLPVEKRSTFLAHAIEKELDQPDALATLAKMWGRVVWKARNHPDLISVEDFARYRAVKDRATS